MSMQSLHVGVVVHSLSHNNIGRVYPFLRAFVGSPLVRYTVFGWNDGGGMFPLLRDLPWPIVTLPGARTSSGAVQALTHAMRDCDLVHCFKNHEHLPATAQAARSLSLPLVLDLDDWELGLYLEGVAHWPTWRRALAGLAVSQQIAAGLELEQLARTIPAATTVNSRALQGYFGGEIVYTAADARAFDPATNNGTAFRAAHGLNVTDTVIGFLGTPHQHKGVDDLLEAFRMARERYAALRLLFVGVPAHNRYATQLAAQPGVVATDYIAADDYPAAYAACDMLAIPQRAVTEGIMQTPAKLILALAAGRAIVATTVGDIPLILGKAGILVPPENPLALARALEQLVAVPPQRAVLGAAARTRFLEAFTLEDLRDTMLPIYLRAAGIS